jgi:hypothetical protein
MTELNVTPQEFKYLKEQLTAFTSSYSCLVVSFLSIFVCKISSFFANLQINLQKCNLS